MDWMQLLFSFKGRIQRLYWWIASLVVGAVAAVLTSSLEFWAKRVGSGMINPDTQEFEPIGPFAIGLGLIVVLNMWINLALSVKRVHDRDRTGWWIAVLYLAIMVAVVLGMVTLMQPEGQRQGLNNVAVIAVIAASYLMIWLFVEIGFLKGTQGPNRFGPDPLGAPQRDARLSGDTSVDA
jgi:uncharacterized membrane protein YhaH (DUF805 family)